MANYSKVYSEIQQQKQTVGSGLQQLSQAEQQMKKYRKSRAYRERLMKDPRFRVQESQRRKQARKQIQSEKQRLQEAQQSLEEYRKQIQDYQKRGYQLDKSREGDLQFTKTTYKAPQRKAAPKPAYRPPPAIPQMIKSRVGAKLPTSRKAVSKPAKKVSRVAKPPIVKKEVTKKKISPATQQRAKEALQRMMDIRERLAAQIKEKEKPKKAEVKKVPYDFVGPLKPGVEREKAPAPITKETLKPQTAKSLLDQLAKARAEAIKKAKTTTKVTKKPPVKTTKVTGIKSKPETLKPVGKQVGLPQTPLERMLISRGGPAANLGKQLYQKRTGQPTTVVKAEKKKIEEKKPILTEAKIKAMPSILKKRLVKGDKVAGIKKEDFVRLPETKQKEAVSTYLKSGGKKTIEVKKVPHDFVGPLPEGVIRETAPPKKKDILKSLEIAQQRTKNPLLKRHLAATVDKIKKMRSEKDAVEEIVENLPPKTEVKASVRSILEQKGYTPRNIEKISKEGVEVAGKKFGVGQWNYEKVVDEISDYLRSPEYITKQRKEVREEYETTGDVPVEIQSQMFVPENIKKAGLEDKFIKKTYEFHIGKNPKQAEKELKQMATTAYKTTGEIPDYVKEQVDVPQSIDDLGLRNEYYDISYRMSLGDITPEKAQETISDLTKEKLESVPEPQAIDWMKTHGKFGEKGEKTWDEVKKEEPAIELVRDEKGFRTELDTLKWGREQWKELEGQPAAQAGKAFGGSVLGGFANPDFWSGLITEGPDKATEAITKWEYGAQKKIHSGDILGYVGKDVLLSTPVTNVILPLAGGAIIGKAMGAIPSVASKLGAAGATKLAAGKAITGKILTGASEILPHTPWVFGASASAGMGADIGGTLALEHAGKVEEGTTLSKAIGYGMQLGSMAAGGYYAKDIPTPQALKKLPGQVKAGALKVKTTAYQRVPKLEKAVSTIKQKVTGAPPKTTYYKGAPGKIEYFDISKGRTVTKPRAVTIEEVGGYRPSVDGRRLTTTAPYEPTYLGKVARGRGLVSTTAKEIKTPKRLTITEETGLGRMLPRGRPKARYATVEELGLPTSTYPATESMLYRPTLTGRVVRTPTGMKYTTSPKVKGRAVTTKELVGESRLRALGEKPMRKYGLPERPMYQVAADRPVSRVEITPTRKAALETIARSRRITTGGRPVREYGLPETTLTATEKPLTTQQLQRRWTGELFREGRRYLYKPMKEYGLPAVSEDMALVGKIKPKRVISGKPFPSEELTGPPVASMFSKEGMLTTSMSYPGKPTVTPKRVLGKAVVSDIRTQALKGYTQPKIKPSPTAVKARPKMGWKQYFEYKAAGRPTEPGYYKLDVGPGGKGIVSGYRATTPKKTSFKFKEPTPKGPTTTTGGRAATVQYTKPPTTIKTKSIKTPKTKPAKTKPVKTKRVTQPTKTETATARSPWERQPTLAELEALEAGTQYTHPIWGRAGGRLSPLARRISIPGKQPLRPTGVIPTVETGMAVGQIVGQIPHQQISPIQRGLQAQVPLQKQLTGVQQIQPPYEIQYQPTESLQSQLQEQQQIQEQKQAQLLQPQQAYEEVTEEVPPPEPEEPAPVTKPVIRPVRPKPKTPSAYFVPKPEKEEKKRKPIKAPKKKKKIGYKERVYKVPDPWEVVGRKAKGVTKKPQYFSLIKRS